MNEKEKQLLNFIDENPYISQNELAEKTGLSRSAVAGYISNLIKKGKILGRAYVIPEKKGITCIGGANVDRKLQVKDEIILKTSNPAETSHSPGGVARNIAENLGRLGTEVHLISIVGDDHEGSWLLEQTHSYVDVSGCQVFPKETTGTYSAILNPCGEMVVALADMNLYNRVDIGFIEKRWGLISSSDLVLVDTNFSEDVIGYIIRRCREEQIPLCVVPVSAPKVKKLPTKLEGVTWFIGNKEEAEALLNCSIQNEGDFFKAAEQIVKKGVEKVVISRGDKGLLYYTSIGEAGVILPSEVEVKDVTGAGDALVSGVLYGHVNKLSVEGACKVGVACATIALQSKDTVAKHLNKQILQEKYNASF
ncbi:pseudouridine kinase [Bacillus pakistanensis]|uniref:Pseudouridine kinase n=1 Tax=Rossellomorea pakistanensis TaxID=992288 RepID=A0ABS2NJI6_9BACI|nr:pseudouridine kinase [Bacillus pakistanensis]